MSKKSTSQRIRNWTFVVYPESVVSGWEDTLTDLMAKEGFSWVKSPIHDQDIWTKEALDKLNNDLAKNGKEPSPYKENDKKKAHYHIVLVFKNPRRFDSVKELANSIGGTAVEAVRDIGAIIQYLAHLNSPDKVQYDSKDIVAHGDIDITKYLVGDRDKISQNIFNDIANDYTITDMRALYFRYKDKPEYLNFIRRRTDNRLMQFMRDNQKYLDRYDKVEQLLTKDELKDFQKVLKSIIKDCKKSIDEGYKLIKKEEEYRRLNNQEFSTLDKEALYRDIITPFEEGIIRAQEAQLKGTTTRYELLLILVLLKRPRVHYQGWEKGDHPELDKQGKVLPITNKDLDKNIIEQICKLYIL